MGIFFFISTPSEYPCDAKSLCRGGGGGGGGGGGALALVMCGPYWGCAAPKGHFWSPGSLAKGEFLAKIPLSQRYIFLPKSLAKGIFLAATKQLYEWFSPSVRLSVRPSVRLSHLFDYVPIILSSWNFQELLPVTKVTSMQKVKVRGQRSRSQRSQPNLTVSGL